MRRSSGTVRSRTAGASPKSRATCSSTAATMARSLPDGAVKSTLPVWM